MTKGVIMAIDTIDRTVIDVFAAASGRTEDLRVIDPAMADIAAAVVGFYRVHGEEAEGPDLQKKVDEDAFTFAGEALPDVPTGVVSLGISESRVALRETLSPLPKGVIDARPVLAHVLATV